MKAGELRSRRSAMLLLSQESCVTLKRRGDLKEERDRGYIHIYTGTGKGKTTAAIGLAIRALGAGKRVLFAQFMKTADFSEHRLLKTLDGLDLLTFGKPFFIASEDHREGAAQIDAQPVVFFAKGEPPSFYREWVKDGLREVEERLQGYELIVLDEILVALSFGLTTEEEIVALLQKTKVGQDILLTGRNASSGLIALADVVTEMVERKHYYRQGVRARVGIDE